MKQYIALQAIQVTDANGNRVSIEPRVEGQVSGLFEHEFDRATEKRLLKLGAIREPEGTEEYEDPTQTEVMHDSREIEGAATTVDPLDHDADGKKGGTKPATETAAQKKARLKAEADAKAKAKAEAEAEADAKAKAEAEADTTGGEGSGDELEE